MNHPVSQRIWVASQNSPITDEQLKRLENLVPKNQRGFETKLAYEVLAFYTEGEWDNCQTEPQLRKCIFAKFRDYQQAEDYAQRLLFSGTYYFKVLLRK